MKKKYAVWARMFFGCTISQARQLAHAMVSEFGGYCAGLKPEDDFEFVIGGRKETKSSKGSSRIDLKHRIELVGEPSPLMRLAMVMQDMSKLAEKHGIAVVGKLTLPAGVRMPEDKPAENVPAKGEVVVA